MKNPLDAWRQWRARRRFMPRPKRRRFSRTTAVSVVGLVVLIAAAALLQLRRGTGAEGEFVEFVRANAEDPLDLIERAATSHRLVFLADIPTATAPKRLVQRAIARLAAGPGLDLVVLDIDADEQPYIDRYLATSPEDASILVGRPRAVREADGIASTYIGIYRAVWSVNQQLGASRRVRIVAADAPGWPPERATSPAHAARLYGQRAEYMLKHVMDRSLARDPNARVLFFVDGLHVLKTGNGRVHVGGTAPIEIPWLATRMREFYPADVYSILVDAAPSRSISTDVVAYRGTAFGDILRRGGVPTGSALRFREIFDDVSRSPIRVVDTTGLEFMLEPVTAPAVTYADAYIFLGS